MNIIWTEKFGDRDICITSEIKAAIKEADEYVRKETGGEITDFLYSVVEENNYFLWSVEERQRHAHGEPVDDYDYSYEEANEEIISSIWASAEHYVDFIKSERS